MQLYTATIARLQQDNTVSQPGSLQWKEKPVDDQQCVLCKLCKLSKFTQCQYYCATTD